MIQHMWNHLQDSKFVPFRSSLTHPHSQPSDYFALLFLSIRYGCSRACVALGLTVLWAVIPEINQSLLVHTYNLTSDPSWTVMIHTRHFLSFHHDISSLSFDSHPQSLSCPILQKIHLFFSWQKNNLYYLETFFLFLHSGNATKQKGHTTSYLVTPHKQHVNCSNRFRECHSCL